MARKSQLGYTLLGIITEASLQKGYSGYIPEWIICDILGTERAQFSVKYPQTLEDEAMKSLIDAGLIEEVPDLGCRYRLKLPQP